MEYMVLSHTSVHVACFRPGNGFSSTSHRDLHPLRVSSVQFVLSFGRGGERAGFAFSYAVALVCKLTLSPSSSREQHRERKPARLRKKPGYWGTTGGLTESEARRSGWWGRKPCGRTRGEKCWLSALRGPRYPGMSRVIETGKETGYSGRRKLMLLYIYFHQ